MPSLTVSRRTGPFWAVPLLIFLVLLSLGLNLAACSGDEGEASRSPGTKPPEKADPPEVVVTAVFADKAAVPGRTIQVLYRLKMAEGWHLYAPLLNDSGYPPEVELDLPAGWRAGPLLWPVPQRYLMPGGILDHVYHHELVLVQEWQVPADAPVGGQVVVPARVSWLACRQECRPGRQDLHLTLPVAAAAEPGSHATEVARAMAALPAPAPADGLLVEVVQGGVKLTVPGAEVLEFYPFPDSVVPADLVAQGRAEGSTLALDLKSPDLNSPDSGQTPLLRGILHQGLAGGQIRNWLVEAGLNGENNLEVDHEQ